MTKIREFFEQCKVTIDPIDHEEFLKIRETIRRLVGVKSKKLEQVSVVICVDNQLHIVPTSLVIEGEITDFEIKRNRFVAQMLESWGLCRISDDTGFSSSHGKRPKEFGISVLKYSDPRQKLVKTPDVGEFIRAL
jgi:hypothetical protein